jgi:CheY-like chemotaxis protein
MKRLLLHTANAEVERSVFHVLERFGVTVDVVNDAEDALLHLTSHRHDIVVVDRVLAAARFDAMIDALRNHNSAKPVVIVTSVMQGADLDPTVVSLVVPIDYDSPTLVGVILACATEGTAPPAQEAPGALLDL